MQTAQDLTDTNVEEVKIQLGKNINFYKTRSNIDLNKQRPLIDTSVPADNKYVGLKKVVLSKPKAPKKMLAVKAKNKRAKRKLELEKRLEENMRRFEMIKNKRKNDIK